MYSTNSYIENRAEKLLDDAKCYTVPVPIEDCAKFLKIKLESLNLEENVAGFLLLKTDKEVHIRYNKKHPKNRIRFTIAHEISHYILHAKDVKLFVDKVEKQILYRDANSSTGELFKEREANAFAAALLMPQRLLLQEVDKHKNTPKHNLIPVLAKKFKVSEQAITIRCNNLGLIDYDNFAF